MIYAVEMALLMVYSLISQSEAGSHRLHHSSELTDKYSTRRTANSLTSNGANQQTLVAK